MEKCYIFEDNKYYEKRHLYNDEDENKENFSNINKLKQFNKNFCNDKCIII